MAKGLQRRRFEDRLKDDRIRTWYEDMCYSGSEITAKVYVRRAFNFQKKTGVSPFDLISNYDKEGLYKLIFDFAKNEKANGKAPSYILSELKSIYAWLNHNRVKYDRIPTPKGAGTTPTLKNEVIPTSDELRKVFMNAPNERDRVSSALMAFSGVRPAVLGNHLGNNGLRLHDLPELIIKDGDIEFKEIPLMIRVDDDLSKTDHNYITFMCEEGADYLRNYLINRMKAGEKLTPNSVVIKSEFGRKEFLVTKSLRTGIRKAIRGAGMSSRPYVLRRYFASRLLEAENSGDIVHSYSQYFMGHSGDMMSTYSMNKGLLQSQIEDMREAYKRCEKYLQTTFRPADQTEQEQTMKVAMLKMMGVPEEEIDAMEIDEMSYDDVSKVIYDRIKGPQSKTNNGGKRVVDPDEGKYLLEEEDWDLVSELNSGEWVMKPPGH